MTKGPEKKVALTLDTSGKTFDTVMEITGKVRDEPWMVTEDDRLNFFRGLMASSFLKHHPIRVIGKDRFSCEVTSDEGKDPKTRSSFEKVAKKFFDEYGDQKSMKTTK